MKRSLHLVLLLLLVIGVVTQCEKRTPAKDNSYGLPNATQEGKQMFACLVNGDPWISKRYTGTPGGGYINDTLWVSGERFNEPANKWDGGFTIALVNAHAKEGQHYRLNNNLKCWAEYGAVNSPCFDYTGSFGNNHTYATDGEIILTRFDTIHRVISGTFWFDAPTQYCDTIHVTNGRFDITYSN